MQMLSELVKLSCPTSLNWHSFMIAKNIQSPKILFPYEKKINYKNATHNIGYVYSNERKKEYKLDTLRYPVLVDRPSLTSKQTECTDIHLLIKILQISCTQ